MKREILLYGLILALLVILLKVLEYRYHIRSLRLEIYLGLVGLVFLGLGGWIGWWFFNRPQRKDLPPTLPEQNPAVREAFNLSDRELEVLQLLAAGMSNQEIADHLYVSVHTVKSHCANLYGKLDVNRRTQAVQKARRLGILVQ